MLLFVWEVVVLPLVEADFSQQLFSPLATLSVLRPVPVGLLEARPLAAH